jgi:hypothetical protein
MNLSNALLTRRVACASVYQAASVAALYCPSCGTPPPPRRLPTGFTAM